MLLFFTGFDVQATADLPYPWTALTDTPVISTVNPRTGPRCLLMNAGSDSLRYGQAVNQAAHVLGFAFRTGALPGAGATTIAKILDGTDIQGVLQLDSAGHLRVYRGAGAALLLTGVAHTMAPNTWYYVEWRYIVNNATGSTKIRVDGADVLEVVAQDTQDTANATASGFSLHGSADSFQFDDVYFINGVNSAPGPNNNNFLGAVRAIANLPDADGATNQWTQDSGANRFSRINEVPADGDASYISSAVVGDRQLVTTGNLASLAGTVFGAQVIAQLRNDDGLAHTAKLTIRPGAANFDSAGVATSAAWVTYVPTIWPYNPDSLLAWTPTTINACQIGVKNEA